MSMFSDLRASESVRAFVDSSVPGRLEVSNEFVPISYQRKCKPFFSHLLVVVVAFEGNLFMGVSLQAGSPKHTHTDTHTQPLACTQSHTARKLPTHMVDKEEGLLGRLPSVSWTGKANTHPIRNSLLRLAAWRRSE